MQCNLSGLPDIQRRSYSGKKTPLHYITTILFCFLIADRVIKFDV